MCVFPTVPFSSVTTENMLCRFLQKLSVFKKCLLMNEYNFPGSRLRVKLPTSSSALKNQ